MFQPAPVIPTIAPNPVPIVPGLILVSAEVKEFAAVCGEVMRADIGNSDADFIAWVANLIDLEAPSELEEFWKASTGQYLLQIDTEADPIKIIGPNEQTQLWFEQEARLVSEMSSDMIQILVEGGCLGEVDVKHSKQIVAAWNRILGDEDFAQPATIEDYVQSCADIKVTVPIMDEASAGIRHMIDWWDILQPPSEAAGYHAATMAVFRAAHEAGDITLVGESLILAINEEAMKVGDAFVGLLIRSGCAG